MKFLRELVLFVNRNKIKNIPILTLDTESPTLVQRLYRAIAEETVDSDDTAATLLFGEANDKNYRKVKHQLSKRLVNTLFFIDLKQEYVSKYDSAFYTCHKQWTAARILRRHGIWQSAVWLFKKTLNKASKFELTAIALDCALQLKYHYALMEGNINQYHYYKATAEKQSAIYRAEREIQDAYEFLLLTYVKRKSGSKQMLLFEQQQYDFLNQPPLISTNRYIYMYYFLKMSKYMLRYDYDSTIRVCNKAISILKNKRYVSNAYFRSFFFQIIVSSTHLQNYQVALDAIKGCNEFVDRKSGDHSWFKLQRLSMMLYFHTQQYQEACHCIEEALNHKKFHKLPEAEREVWLIGQAYVAFLVDCKKIVSDNPIYVQFKVGKFLNSLPVFSQDKSGLNIPILVVQVLLQLVKKEYGKIELSIESLEVYGSRYLRTDNNNFRSHCFIKMIAQLVKGHFHQAAVKRKAQKYLARLHQVPLKSANQAHEIEFIPYEILWELITEQLDNRFH